ncbi:MAG: hypothetical protein GY927_05305 [bacterium]|nr:hypothetical protein [bacterium]
MKMIMTAVFGLIFVLSSTQSYAKSRSLAGSWKGGGSFTTSSGGKERTRCRAKFRAQKSGRYSVYARCSVASVGLLKQSATVRSVGKNRYRGRFSNSEYDVHGSITIVVKGNRQYITLRSTSGRGDLVFRRR